MRFPVLVAALLALAACDGGGDTAPTTTPSSTSPPTTSTIAPDVEAPDLISGYVLALADPLADPGALAVGDALAYLDYRRLAADVFDEELVALPGQTTHQLCDADGCVEIADVETDPATGRVVTFTVDGRPIDGRIGGSGLIADDDGVVAQARTAYVTGAGQLIVTVEVTDTTDAEVELFGFAAVLQPADGSGGVEAAAGFGDAIVQPGGTSVLVLVFDTDEPGGRIGLRGVRADGLDVTLEIDVPGG